MPFLSYLTPIHSHVRAFLLLWTRRSDPHLTHRVLPLFPPICSRCSHPNPLPPPQRRPPLLPLLLTRHRRLHPLRCLSIQHTHSSWQRTAHPFLHFPPAGPPLARQTSLSPLSHLPSRAQTRSHRCTRSYTHAALMHCSRRFFPPLATHSLRHCPLSRRATHPPHMCRNSAASGCCASRRHSLQNRPRATAVKARWLR